MGHETCVIVCPSLHKIARAVTRSNLICVNNRSEISALTHFVRDINPCVGKGPGPDLTKLDKSFQEYFQSMIVSVNEPLKLCATFVKIVCAYLRCYHGTRNSDFYLLEQERSDWIGAHKITGKANYVTETCRSHETIYDSNLTDYEREGMRTNIFNTLQRDGSAQAHDMLNKAQLLWNKSCTKNPNFDTVRMKNQSV